ncbi:MAG: hypothetical protein WA705_11165 [Candidatus Ozemobacteraceae bacterium]
MSKRMNMLATAFLAVVLASPAFAGFPEQSPMVYTGQVQQYPGQTQQYPGQTQQYPGTGCNNPCSQSSGSNQTGNFNNANSAANQALIMMFSLIATDLEMCRASLQGGFHPIHNGFAIGYLNNAKNALSRSSVPMALYPLMRELHERIEKARFHLLMGDINNTAAMLAQLSSVVRSMLSNLCNGAVDGGIAQMNTSNNGGTYQRPVVYPQIPVGGLNGGWTSGFGGGQQVTPSGFPTTMTPVN